jgi:hypothetical protein
MKEFYMSTNKTCVLNLIWGGRGTPTSGKVFLSLIPLPWSHLSCTSPLIHEKEKKNRNLLRYMCVCEYINSFKKYSMKKIKMSRKKLS